MGVIKGICRPRTFGCNNCGSETELKIRWGTFQYKKLLSILEDCCVEQAMSFTTGCDSISSFSGIWNQKILERMGGSQWGESFDGYFYSFYFIINWRLTVKFKSFWRLLRGDQRLSVNMNGKHANYFFFHFYKSVSFWRDWRFFHVNIGLVRNKSVNFFNFHIIWY